MRDRTFYFMVVVVIAVTLAIILCRDAKSQTICSTLVNEFRILTDEIASEGSLVQDSELVVFFDRAQDKLITLKGYLHRSTDIIYSEDSNSYGLPSTFKGVDGIMVSLGQESYQWVGMIPNPYLLADTSAPSYWVGWSGLDTARIYVKSARFFSGDTIRVFYMADADDIAAVTDTVELPTLDQAFLLEEAIANYERAMRNHAIQQQTQTQTRLDMGVMQRGPQQ